MWKVIQVTWHTDLHFQVQGKKLSFCNYFPAQTYKNQRKRSLFNTHHSVQHQIHALCHFFWRGLDFPLVLIIHFLLCCQEDASPGHSLFCCFKIETLIVLPKGRGGGWFCPANNPANLAPLLDFILCNNIDLPRSVDIVCNLNRGHAEPAALNTLLPPGWPSWYQHLSDMCPQHIAWAPFLPFPLAGGNLPTHKSQLCNFIFYHLIVCPVWICHKWEMCKFSSLDTFEVPDKMTQDGIILSILKSH